MRSFLFLFCFSCTWAFSQSGQTPIVPLDPVTLLKEFPRAAPGPDGWSLTKATALNEFSQGWLVSRAFRTFERPANPPTDPTAILEISLIDTGFHPPFLTLFQDFQPGSSAVGEKLLAEGIPICTLAGSDEIWLCFGQRFVLRLKGTNLSPAEMRQLAGAAAKFYAGLAKLPSKGTTEIPRPYAAMRIDELHPENNRQHMATYLTPEEITANQERIERQYDLEHKEAPSAKKAN